MSGKRSLELRAVVVALGTHRDLDADHRMRWREVLQDAQEDQNQQRNTCADRRQFQKPGAEDYAK